MSFRKKKVLSFVTLFVLLVVFSAGSFGSVTAAEAVVACRAKQTGADKVTVEGQLSKTGEGYVIQVYAPSKKASDLSSADDATNTDVIVFQEQGKTDEKGKYTHDFVIGKSGVSGKYTVAFFSAETGFLAEASTFNFTLLSAFTEPAEELNKLAEKKDMDGFKIFAKENAENLGFYDEVFNIENRDNAYSILYEDMQKNPLDTSDIPEATRAFMRACLISENNDGKIDNIFEYDEYFDEEIASFINHTENDEGLQKEITERIGKCSNSEEFFEEIAVGLLLEKVKNHNGISNIRKVMRDTESFCGIDPDDYSDYELIEASGKEYDSIEDFADALGDVETPVQKPSYGGGGGGGSRGASTVVASQDKEIPEPEEIGYDIYTDIDNVVWARNAIVTLSDMGILKGREDLKFYPDDNVLREEFVKMIVLAFREDAEEAEISFTDVVLGEWYYPYIAKAKGAGLVNGYSEDIFGIGHNITREDLCVMAYNAYKSVKEAESADSVEFEDADMISDYAKEAVAFLSGKGIVNGVDGEHFEPKANATRAQAAKIIYMLLDI